MRAISIPGRVIAIIRKYLDDPNPQMVKDLTTFAQRADAEGEIRGITKASRYISDPSKAKQLQDIKLTGICENCKQVVADAMRET